MGTFNSVFNMFLVCGLFGAASGIVCMLAGDRPVSLRETLAYIGDSLLATFMGVGVATLWTLNIPALIAVSILCGRCGERTFAYARSAARRGLRLIDKKAE